MGEADAYVAMFEAMLLWIEAQAADGWGWHPAKAAWGSPKNTDEDEDGEGEGGGCTQLVEAVRGSQVFLLLLYCSRAWS